MTQKSAIFFIFLFAAIISAPTVIMSMDDSVDITSFYSLNEEEESENLKVIFEGYQSIELNLDNLKNTQRLGYIFKAYPKPHLNLIFPPPEFIS